MRAIFLVLVAAAPCWGQWRVENVVLFEKQESPSDAQFYAVRGVAPYIADASLTPLWNGWQVNIYGAQECLDSPPGWIGSACRTGRGTVEFDLVVDAPTAFRWEMWRHIESGLTIAPQPGLPVAGWVDIDQMVNVPAGSYHFRAVAIAATAQSPQYVDATMTIPVPEPGAAIMTVVGLSLVAWRRRKCSG